MLNDIDIIDSHVHLFAAKDRDRLLEDLRYTGAKQWCMLVTERNWTGTHVTERNSSVSRDHQWDNCLNLKKDFPNDCFFFGGLDFRGMVDQHREKPDVPFEKQLQEIIDLGGDGLKMLAGKPDRRKAIGVGLDAPCFDAMLGLAEEKQFPVLWHVGDPPEFWSEHTVPQWARIRGWWYPPGTPTKPQIEKEIGNVFKRHPKLKLTLPHFFFLSDRLQDAAELLEAHPSYALDLAPGVELLHNLSAQRDKARDFFIRFADQILFGTDFGLSCGWAKDRGMMIRRWLETSESFDVPEDPAMTPDDRPQLKGLNLPRPALEKIYKGNFHRRVGKKPVPLKI